MAAFEQSLRIVVTGQADVDSGLTAQEMLFGLPGQFQGFPGNFQ